MVNLNGPMLAPALYLFERARARIEERMHGFDARFGTDTANPFLGREHDAHSYFYVPTSSWLIYEILESIPLTPKRFEFVDIGSGKGRALLIASEFPFKKIVGIELSRELNNIASDNIEKYNHGSQISKNINVHCMDALDYSFGQSPIVLFFYDPFGPETLQKLMSKLKTSLEEYPREAFVAYIYPQFQEICENSGFLHKYKRGRPWWQPWNSYAIYKA